MTKGKSGGEEPKSDETNSLMNKSFKNVGLLMLVQVFSKIMTFSLNFLVARIVVKEVFGYANIQL